MSDLSDEILERIAARLKAMGNPFRLKILHALQGGELTVTEILARVGGSQANVSKHLALLAEAGLVLREARGTSAYYRFADPQVYELCDLVCGQVARSLEDSAKLRKALDAMAARAIPKP